MPPANTSTAPAAAAPRRSTRSRVCVRRFRPGVTGERPDALTEMISKIATAQAAASNVAIESGAISELENALELVLDHIFALSSRHAQQERRRTIEPADIQYAAKQFKAIQK